MRAQQRLPRGQSAPHGSRLRAVIQRGCGGIRGQQGEFHGGGRSAQLAKHFIDRALRRRAEGRHAGRGIQHHGHALHRVPPQPARLGQQPGQQQHHEKLKPEGDGDAQLFKAVPRAALPPHLLQQKQGRACHAPLPPLKKMNRHHHRQPQQCPKPERVGKGEAGGDEGHVGRIKGCQRDSLPHPISTAPAGTPSVCSALRNSASEDTRTRAMWCLRAAAFQRSKWRR